MSFTVFPAVDISDGRCVRPLQGRFGAETVYSDDPAKVAIGLSSAGARWLHIVDLDGARTGVSANRDLVLEAVKLASCPVQAGGGVRTWDDVTEILAAGANRVVLGAFALEDRAEARRVCERFGERIVVSLDARGDGEGDAWTVAHGIPVVEAVKEFEHAGVSTFVYTDVTRDGTMSGPDVDGLRRMLAITDRPVIASGGIASLDELRLVARMRAEGVSGAIVGRALYENKFGVGEANYAADEASSARADEPG
ncbi:MAG TPA: 1-(5-phosphoribosyl)-5-[(5-phosphoribosylamino)methylideneamino] imidazole-4-carboxamide isomerase [Actinomycetota bacterium]|nr:1-(5-phosphoribosyl)-5-[(5-phosphoribosylamino)methylideneamino] imidazole-4-carboxamide isomerase [Actinomycetota bacterium]